MIAFVISPLRTFKIYHRPSRSFDSSASPLRRIQASADSHIPTTVNEFVRSWENSRSLSAGIDMSRRFLSILLVSENCHRALIAEKTLAQLAVSASVSRRLLILSAGLRSRAGDPLPRFLVGPAARRGIDLTEKNPCAAFDIFDLDYYDFVLVMDRNVKDQLMRKAVIEARKSGGHLYDWERKIRLLADFDGSREAGTRSAGLPIDIPPLNAGGDPTLAMDCIRESCVKVLEALLRAGL